MNELTTVTHGTAVIPTATELTTMLSFADALFKSGLLPDSIKSPQAAFGIIQKGRELGIPAMYALSNINVIKGKPTCSSELMSALIYRDHGDNGLRVIEQTDKVCTVEYRRREWKQPGSYSFTWEMATKAGLTNSDTYRKFPGTMLMRRAVSNVAKRDFTDSIGGMYLPEELGTEVMVDSEGAVTVVEESPQRAETATPRLTNRPDVDTATGEIMAEVVERPGDALVLEQPRPDTPKPSRDLTSAEEHRHMDRIVGDAMLRLAQQDNREFTDVVERVKKAVEITGSLKEQPMETKQAALDWLTAELESVTA